MITREKLLEQINLDEWDKIELKEVSSKAQLSALKTVSAFANKNGGVIVFGVSEKDGKLTVTGVKDVDRVQNDFLTLTRNPQKFSHRLPVSAEALQFDAGPVLCFHIPEAPVEDKPVCLNGDLSASYIRKGASDFRCSREELGDFLRNASAEKSYDHQPINTDPECFFDTDSLSWFRSVFEGRRSNKDSDLSNFEFLKKHGFFVEHKGRLVPNRAAILLFGDEENFINCLPKMVVDMHFYKNRQEDYCPIKRWDDREIIEDNLINSWKKINDFFDKHSLRPFRLNPVTLQRIDDPPENATYREAALNLITHQDYGNIGLNAMIRVYEDKVEFANPGNAFLSRRQLLIPGLKKSRNPLIASAFRQIGLSEQAGSGVPQAFTNWRLLGYTPPTIENDKTDRIFKLTFPKQKLIEKEELVAIEATGATLDEKQAMVFAYLYKFGEANTLDLMALTGLFDSGAIKTADSLVKMKLARRTVSKEAKFVITKHNNFSSLTEGSSSGENGVKVRPTGTISKVETKILSILDQPKSLSQIMRSLGYVDRKSFQNNHLKPLIERGAVIMTKPDSPRSPGQEYIITEIGRQLLGA